MSGPDTALPYDSLSGLRLRRDTPILYWLTMLFFACLCLWCLQSSLPSDPQGEVAELPSSVPDAEKRCPRSSNYFYNQVRNSGYCYMVWADECSHGAAAASCSRTACRSASSSGTARSAAPPTTPSTVGQRAEGPVPHCFLHGPRLMRAGHGVWARQRRARQHRGGGPDLQGLRGSRRAEAGWLIAELPGSGCRLDCGALGPWLCWLICMGHDHGRSIRWRASSSTAPRT